MESVALITQLDYINQHLATPTDKKSLKNVLVTIGIMLSIVLLGLKMRPARNCSVLLVYQSDKRKN